MRKPHYNNWKSRPFFTKLLHWEYWPFGVVYFPVFFYYLWLSIRARSLWFFNAANPGIETGGMLGESKTPILDMVPDAYKPITISVNPGIRLQELKKWLSASGIQYPIIAKPDRGERGLMVERINSDNALDAYLHKMPYPFLIQEYVDYKEEFGVLYYILPGEKRGRVVSVVMKEFLKVRGDGKSTMQQLIEQSPRALLHWNKLVHKFGHRFDEVLPMGEELELEPIGNHVRGTKFINGNRIIDDQLHEVFAHITNQLHGIYYCRFDLRCTNVDDLKAGKNIRIVEINGVGAEPAHIYDPDYRIADAWKDMFRLWDAIYSIARDNHKKGVPYMTTREIIQQWNKVKKYRNIPVS